MRSGPANITASVEPRRAMRRGFTLLNVMMTVAVLAIVLAVSLPAFSSANPGKLVGAAYVLMSDLEYAQSRSMVEPDDLTVVRFDAPSTTYWLAAASDTETPILRPGSNDPYLVQFGVGAAEMLGGVSIALTGETPVALEFDEFGRLSTLGDATIDLGEAGHKISLRVSSATGFVEIE